MLARRSVLFGLLLWTTSLTSSAQDAATASPWPPLPVGVSSLGAVAADGYLYVYGGHAGKTHSYDTQSVLGTFHRLPLQPNSAAEGRSTWESLPGGTRLQGMNLVAYQGKIIRVGGMEPRNEPGTPANNVSVATVVQYDPVKKTWSDLPALPQPRSSHDVVVVGSQLFVFGGWAMRGAGQKPEWHQEGLVLDLNHVESGWKALSQPFQKRALTMVALGSKVYVLGGLTAEGAERTVNIYDTKKQSWSEGPAIPGSERVGFSPAAAVLQDRLILNTSAGLVARLTTDGQAWEKVGQAKIKRMVARLLPHGTDQVILVGGASSGGNVAEVEVFRIPAQGERLEQD